jgi:hypothetical protein
VQSRAVETKERQVFMIELLHVNGAVSAVPTSRS